LVDDTISAGSAIFIRIAEIESSMLLSIIFALFAATPMNIIMNSISI
jgi:hypothetical protein